MNDGGDRIRWNKGRIDWEEWSIQVIVDRTSENTDAREETEDTEEEYNFFVLM